MGKLAGGQVVRGTSGDGVSIEYNSANERKKATYARDGHFELYDYDANGQLTVRSNDLAGRVTQYQEVNADNSLRTSSSRKTCKTHSPPLRLSRVAWAHRKTTQNSRCTFLTTICSMARRFASMARFASRQSKLFKSYLKAF